MTKANPLWCEHQVAQIMHNQETHGVNFDSAKARFLILKLSEEILELDMEAIPQLPMMMNKAGEYKKPFLKSGKLAKWPTLYCEEHKLPVEVIGAPFTRLWYTPFDMSKTDKVKRVLIDYGWIPDEWNQKQLDKDAGERCGKAGVSKEQMMVNIIDGYVTKNFVNETSAAWKNTLLNELRYRGARNRRAITDFLLHQRFIPTSPKLTESSLDTVDGTVGLLVMKRVQLSHRRSLLQGLLRQVRPDGKLSAGANSCATPTYRMKHRTVVNIPAARSVYGKQLRGLFIGDADPSAKARMVGGKYVPAGQWDFVGYDASGLELRMLAHYMGDDSYTHILLTGDIHSHNQALAGLPTRDDAKTFIYAHNYGAGDAKLGLIVGGGKAAGKQIRQEFMSGLPLLDALISRVKKQAESGYLEGLDGRPLVMRTGYDGKPQVHKALNTLLQAAGSIVMKYAMIYLDHWIKQANLRAYKVIDMHDESQYTCHPDDTPKLTQLMEVCVKAAGEYLKLQCPLASDAMVGKSWFDTH